ncbi:hypothetical protein DITRI_Ditri16bG0053900 [Diplodiscus trichospermus]
MHRDIKSSNVMLGSNFSAKLDNFGLAKLMDHETGPKTTRTRRTLGNLAFEYISTLHRDIKSSNVMLESSFSARLGNFGLAKLIDHDIGPKTTRVAGTLGYLALEYINTGRASKESNVYSFGVAILGIATRRKSLDPR